MEQNKNLGLSNKNRTFILVIIVAFLLLFGPVGPYGMFIRFFYLITIPTLIWIILGHYGKNWKINKLTNDKLTSTLCGVVAGVFLAMSYTSFTASHHSECTEVMQTRDGQECVGDYIAVKGPDKAGAIIELIFASVALYFAVHKESEKVD